MEVAQDRRSTQSANPSLFLEIPLREHMRFQHNKIFEAKGPTRVNQDLINSYF